MLGALASVGTRLALVHVTGGLQLDAAARRRFREVGLGLGPGLGREIGPGLGLGLGSATPNRNPDSNPKVERVPGTAFGMTLRGSGGETYSDFEVVVLEASY